MFDSALTARGLGLAEGTPAVSQARLIAVSELECDASPDGAGLRALFESILQVGVIQPLVVRPAAAGRYEVLVGRKRFAAARSAGLAEVPCCVFQGSEAQAAALVAASNLSSASARLPVATAAPPMEGAVPLLRELRAIRSTIVGMLDVDGRQPEGLRQRVARELLEAELQRASWVVDALLALQGPADSRRAQVAIGPLLRACLEPFRPECRLAGISAHLTVEPQDLAVTTSEAGLRAALNCLLGAVLATMHGSADQGEPLLAIEARATGGGAVIRVTQNVLPLQALARIRSGGRLESREGEPPLAAFAFEAARRVVEAVGGRVELRLEPGTPGGAVDVKLPAAPAAQATGHDGSPSGGRP